MFPFILQRQKALVLLSFIIIAKRFWIVKGQGGALSLFLDKFLLKPKIKCGLLPYFFGFFWFWT